MIPKNKKRSYVYTINPSEFPQQSDILFYRGDEISITFIGIHSDLFELNDGRKIFTPFDFSIFDTFRLHFRPNEDSETFYEAKDENFILGRSDDAILYDQQKDTQFYTETYDELTFLDPSYQILREVRNNYLVMDIEAREDETINTLRKFTIDIIPDVTHG